MEVMSSWQAAMYKAFYEQQLKEQKEGKEIVVAKKDLGALENASVRTAESAQVATTDLDSSLTATNSKGITETTDQQPRKRSGGLLKSIVLKSRNSRKTSKS